MYRQRLERIRYISPRSQVVDESHSCLQLNQEVLALAAEAFWIPEVRDVFQHTASKDSTQGQLELLEMGHHLYTFRG